MRSKVKKLTVSKNSTLIVGADCNLEDVNADGYVKLNSKSVVIRNNKYGKLVAT